MPNWLFWKEYGAEKHTSPKGYMTLTTTWCALFWKKVSIYYTWFALIHLNFFHILSSHSLHLHTETNGNLLRSSLLCSRSTRKLLICTIFSIHMHKLYSSLKYMILILYNMLTFPVIFNSFQMFILGLSIRKCLQNKI